VFEVTSDTNQVAAAREEQVVAANEHLERIFDTLIFGMDVSEFAETVQAIVSDVDGGAPKEAALREAFAEQTGTYSMTYHPNVSTITGSRP